MAKRIVVILGFVVIGAGGGAAVFGTAFAGFILWGMLGDWDLDGGAIAVGFFLMFAAVAGTIIAVLGAVAGSICGAVAGWLVCFWLPCAPAAEVAGKKGKPVDKTKW